MSTPPPDPRLLARQAAAVRQEFRVVVTHGDDRYVLRLGDVTALTAARFRRETGRPVLAVLAPVFAGHEDIEAWAAAMWLARLNAGEDVTWAALAAGVTLGDEITVVHEDDEDDGSAADVMPDPLPSVASSVP